MNYISSACFEEVFSFCGSFGQLSRKHDLRNLSSFCILIDATWLIPIIEQASEWTGSRWTSGRYLMLGNSDPASKHLCSSLSQRICSHISTWRGWIQHLSGWAAGLSLTLTLNLILTINLTLILTNSATCELNMDVFGSCKRCLPAAVHGGHEGRVWSKYFGNVVAWSQVAPVVPPLLV